MHELVAVNWVVEPFVDVPQDIHPFVTEISHGKMRKRQEAFGKAAAAVNAEGPDHLLWSDIAGQIWFLYELIGVGLKRLFQGSNPTVSVEDIVDEDLEPGSVSCLIICISGDISIFNIVHSYSQAQKLNTSFILLA
jgi:hypothetical protein